MPLFDFKCSDSGCEKVFEKITPSSTTEVECPSCGGKAVKQLSAPGDFKCKGSAGFYKPGANFKTK